MCPGRQDEHIHGLSMGGLRGCCTPSLQEELPQLPESVTNNKILLHGQNILGLSKAELFDQGFSRNIDESMNACIASGPENASGKLPKAFRAVKQFDINDFMSGIYQCLPYIVHCTLNGRMRCHHTIVLDDANTCSRGAGGFLICVLIPRELHARMVPLPGLQGK